MRPLLVSIVLLFLFVPQTSAQTTLGVKAQTGNAWLTFPDGFIIEAYDFRILHWGYSIEVFRQLSPKLALGAAPGYVRRGSEREIGFINGFGPRFRAQLYLNYVELPFYLKFKQRPGGRFSTFAQTGAGLSYLTGGYREVETFNVGNPPPNEVRPFDFEGLDENINRLDFGWYSSIGFSYRLGPGELSISVDYYHGFVDFNPFEPLKNRTWAVGLGYAFRLGKKEG